MPYTGDLFPASVVARLSSNTSITSSSIGTESFDHALWLQLIPLWLDAGKKSDVLGVDIWSALKFDDIRLFSSSFAVSEAIKKSRERRASIAKGRGTLFSRSANYMGSKTSLAAELIDILDSKWGSHGYVLDLMTGSGAVSGAMARFHPVFASDAQRFSRLLARVQGGGMSKLRAAEIAGRVMDHARRLFMPLSLRYEQLISEEDAATNSELSEDRRRELLWQLSSHEANWRGSGGGKLEATTGAWETGSLVAHLYAGVYLGWRQAIEVDCLRCAIEDITDGIEREWALGALICAVSACAFTYGGHFAQPKFDASSSSAADRNLTAMLKFRSSSITHEFFARLTSLAEESEMVSNEVSTIDGPWQSAMEKMRGLADGIPVCVYLDPPYTRDEYSRYYHVLEVICSYRPISVSGKGRIPVRGSDQRFASIFGSRSARDAEDEIEKILVGCADMGWDCLWSYSSSGVADMKRILDRVSDRFGSIDIFKSDYAYSAQGRAPVKRVTEYMVYLKSSVLG